MPGFIRRQSKDSFAVYVPTGQKYPSGEPIRHYETIRRLPGETDAELETRAKARKAELELQYYRGEYVAAPKKYTVGNLLDDWLSGPVMEKLAAGKLRETTQGWYAKNVRIYLKPALQDYPVAALTEADLESAYHRMRARGVPEAALAGAHRTLRAALNWAVRRRLIRVNPLNFVEDPPTIPEVERPTLTVEDARKLIQAAQITDPGEAAVLAALLTGARIGEVLGLRREDVDFEAGEIRIRQAVKMVGSRIIIGPPKSRKSIRDIPMTPLLAEVLRAVITAQEARKQKRIKKGLRYQEHGLIFANRYGGPLNRANLSRRTFPAMLTRADLPRVRLHDLRHTFATLAQESGFDSKRVADALGHTDPRLVERRYAHRTRRGQRELYDRMGEILSGEKRT